MDPTQRFSGRTTDYVKHRPSYPDGVLAVLRKHCGLDGASAVADLGAGTGIFSRLILTSGATVFAVEPNDEMRAAAAAELGANPRFRAVAGRAEATTLESGSVDLVTAAQAFHWFDVPRATAEMRRVLRPPKNVALVWNDRDLTATPFLREYEALLARFPEYAALQGRANATDKFDVVFGVGRYARHTLANEQRHDRDGLIGRVMSASYIPREGTPGHDALVAQLGELFDRHAHGGVVRILYTTVIITGQLQS